MSRIADCHNVHLLNEPGMPVMFVYLDETEFGEGAFSGYASLITETRIEQKVIDEALEDLRNDHDRFKMPQRIMDDRTLERGFFHAADDSKNAHSHFCNSINKHVVGDFKSHVFHLNECGFSDVNEMYNLASKLSVVGLFSKSKNLTFIFERRSGLSVNSLLEKWWPELWKGLSQNCFISPFIVKYYPDVMFEISDKNEPGLQVVDFMLWSSQRAAYMNDSKWYDRLNGWSKVSMSTVGGSWDGHSIARIIPRDTSLQRYDSQDCSRATPLLEEGGELTIILVNVQKVINYCCSRSGIAHVAHFASELEFLFNSRLVKGGYSFVVRMADCFIKLFDNIELIAVDTPADEKTFWLMARKFMALALRDDMEAEVHRIRLCHARNFLIENHPELLEEGIS